LRADAVAREEVRLVHVPRTGDRVSLHSFASLPSLLARGDLLVVNDAATLPASLAGSTARGDAFELRLSEPVDGARLVGIVLGAGDWRTRTEHRAPAPVMPVGSLVRIGKLIAQVVSHDGMRVELAVDEVLERGGVPAEPTADGIVAALYTAGRPVQYAHRDSALPLWSVQTAYAARPWAVEMPSAGRPLTWDVLLAARRAGIAIASVTHAAGLGSIGDARADRVLPFPERYEIPARTAGLVTRTKAAGQRVIAVGTSVVRALEASEARAGEGIATLRLDAAYRPRVVDGLVSGLHVPGESHHDLLRAFTSSSQLDRMLALAMRAGLSAHELGDTCVIV
jgi:S-adenosylmethionine:tRNA ribosyltransferase-isomerase